MFRLSMYRVTNCRTIITKRNVLQFFTDVEPKIKNFTTEHFAMNVSVDRFYQEILKAKWKTKTQRHNT